ncbi:glycosyltransferase [Ensifer sp. SL37]|uniref:glycosyltransferase n=1 Tax=Ensifer sp. SL37 TaxID=2995137 RepID=UPI00227671A9|nr:glycosyltransferase [Ensifer sp. SL37]MCY1740368.1 glycosyltransferase [Ensifer sp. SL37]
MFLTNIMDTADSGVRAGPSEPQSTVKSLNTHEYNTQNLLTNLAVDAFGEYYSSKESSFRKITLIAGETLGPYYHSRGTEFLTIVEGAVDFCGQELRAGETVRIDTGEIAQLKALTETSISSLTFPFRSALTYHPIAKRTVAGGYSPAKTSDVTVSIIIIAKNIDRYISHCISSCINQTYQGLQVIVVDDNSTDATFAKARRMALFDKRIEVYSEKLGVNGARKFGLAKATGDFCLIVDGDDWISIDTVEKLLGVAIEKSSECVVFGFDHHNDKTRIIRDPVYPTDVLLHSPPVYYEKSNLAAFQISHLNHTVWMYFFARRLSKYAEQALPDLPLYEDLPFFIALLQHASNPSMCNLVLYHYRRERAGQATENWIEVKSTQKRACLELAVKHTLGLVARDSIFFQLILMYKIRRIVRYERDLCLQAADAAAAEAWTVQWRRLMELLPRSLAEEIVDDASRIEFEAALA